MIDQSNREYTVLTVLDNEAEDYERISFILESGEAVDWVNEDEFRRAKWVYFEAGVK